jgi:hypothetical protein
MIQMKCEEDRQVAVNTDLKGPVLAKGPCVHELDNGHWVIYGRTSAARPAQWPLFQHSGRSSPTTADAHPNTWSVMPTQWPRASHSDLLLGT